MESNDIIEKDNLIPDNDGLETGMTDLGTLGSDMMNFLEDNSSSDDNDNKDIDLKDIVPPVDKLNVTPDVVTNTDPVLTENEFQIFADDFKNKGILSEEDFEDEEDGWKFDGSEESFGELFERKAFKNSIAILENIVETMEPKHKAIMKTYLDGVESEKSFEFGNKLGDLSNVTKETLDADPARAKQIYVDFLKSKDFDQADIDELIETAEATNDLTEKAFKASQKIKADVEKQVEAEKTKSKQIELDNKAREVAKAQNLKTNIFSKKELITGIPVNDALKEKIFKNMTTPTETLNGKPVTKLTALIAKNPEQFNIIINYLAELEFFKHDKENNLIPDATKLLNYKKSTAQSDVVNRIKNLAQQKTGGANSMNPTSPSTASALEAMKKALEIEE